MLQYEEDAAKVSISVKVSSIFLPKINRISINKYLFTSTVIMLIIINAFDARKQLKYCM